MESLSPEATGANAVPLSAHVPRRTAYERPASRIDGVDTSLVTEARLVDLECQVRRLTDAFQVLGSAHAVASGVRQESRGGGRFGGRGRGRRGKPTEAYSL